CDAGVGHRSAQVDVEGLEAGRGGRADGARRGVVAELELVDHAAAEDALQVEHRVGRVGGDQQVPAGHAVRRVAGALIVEDARVGGPVGVQLDVDAAAEGVFRD